MDFNQKLSEYCKIIEQKLEEYLTIQDNPQKNIYNAMRYSLMAGGKRLRPVLSLAVADIYGVQYSEVIPYACGIEMIHTYSLIHDDLPCMDNDDLRRGRATCHKVYGEAMALLAGDALLNKAFEIMSQDVVKTNSLTKAQALAKISVFSGTEGMIGGQVVDIENESKVIAQDTLSYMHRLKTGALLKAPVISAAIICNSSDEQLKSLEKYAEDIGLAFQIQDDILDVEGEVELLGKPIGSDKENSKVTYVSLYGLQKSKNMVRQLTEEALKELDSFKDKAWFLKELAQYLANRKK